MLKKGRFIALAILCILFGGGGVYSNSVTNYLSSFSYVTGPIAEDTYLDAWFTDDPDATVEDPTFKTKSIDQENLDSPQFYLVVEKIGNVTIKLSFTQFKHDDYDPIDYDITVSPYQGEDSVISATVNTDSVTESFVLTDKPGEDNSSVYRSVYGFIYDFGTNLDGAVANVVYESTVTVTVSEGV